MTKNAKGRAGAFSFQAESTLSCPQCGVEKRELMPRNACQWFYECSGCGVLLSPREGDCCVFCSYGTDKCPPKQLGICCH